MRIHGKTASLVSDTDHDLIVSSLKLQGYHFCSLIAISMLTAVDHQLTQYQTKIRCGIIRHGNGNIYLFDNSSDSLAYRMDTAGNRSGINKHHTFPTFGHKDTRFVLSQSEAQLLIPECFYTLK